MPPVSALRRHIQPGTTSGTACGGISYDTPAFAAHSIATLWRREGSRRCDRVSKLLGLAGSGGSNSWRSRAWKAETQSQSWAAEPMDNDDKLLRLIRTVSTRCATPDSTPVCREAFSLPSDGAFLPPG